MFISSRTPEGQPAHCPLCGSEFKIEPSRPAGDAPCPNCGHLLWLAKGSPKSSSRHTKAALKAALIPGSRSIPESHLTEMIECLESISTREDELLRNYPRTPIWASETLENKGVATVLG